MDDAFQPNTIQIHGNVTILIHSISFIQNEDDEQVLCVAQLFDWVVLLQLTVEGRACICGWWY